MTEPPKALHLDRIGDPGCCDECGDELELVDVDYPHAFAADKGSPRPMYGKCQPCAEWGPPCMTCGERGTMPDGDENDCRSASCMSDAVDQAESLLEDR